jgi:hypothetical protein
MKIAWSTDTPRKIQQFSNPDCPRDNPDLEDVLTSADVDHVAQIFQTPSYRLLQLGLLRAG